MEQLQWRAKPKTSLLGIYSKHNDKMAYILILREGVIIYWRLHVMSVSLSVHGWNFWKLHFDYSLNAGRFSIKNKICQIYMIVGKYDVNIIKERSIDEVYLEKKLKSGGWI